MMNTLTLAVFSSLSYSQSYPFFLQILSITIFLVSIFISWSLALVIASPTRGLVLLYSLARIRTLGLNKVYGIFRSKS